MTPSPFSLSPDGLVVRVALIPKAGSNQIDGLIDRPDGAALKVRVTAVPEKGKANAALIKLLAKSFGIAGGRFSLISGPKDRHKRLLIADGDKDLQCQLEIFTRATTEN